jgi:hypothetical protein
MRQPLVSVCPALPATMIRADAKPGGKTTQQPADDQAPQQSSPLGQLDAHKTQVVTDEIGIQRSQQNAGSEKHHE